MFALVSLTELNAVVHFFERVKNLNKVLHRHLTQYHGTARNFYTIDGNVKFAIIILKVVVFVCELK